MNRVHAFAIALVSIGVVVFSLSRITLPDEPQMITVFFGGDMMFDRSVREAGERHGDDHLLACLDPLFVAVDTSVANLEGPITAEDSVSVGSTPGGAGNYTFTFPLSTATLLAEHRVGFVSLGNNHIMNFGTAGVRSTLAALDAAQVGAFGDPLTHRVERFEKSGTTLSFIGFNQFDGAGLRAAASTTLAQVRAERAAGAVPIVFAHWGEEYEPATQYQKNLAREFVDAGALFVVGAHPHVVQEHETYRGVPIYYSLGNLVFDQYWDSAVQRGLTLLVSFDATGVVNIAEMPVFLQRDRQTCPRTNQNFAR
jgi:poly-gamma-glutamate synthesis protein (capsule biosynthesis protein)